MKKIVLLVFVLLAAVLFSACGGTPTPSAPSPSNGAVTSQPSPSEAASPSQAPSPSPSPDLTKQTGSGTVGDFEVKILDFALTKDYEDKPAVIINYEWTNNSDEATAFLFAVNSKVYQGGVECQTAILMDVDGYDVELQMSEIKPGVTLKVQAAYTLRDETTPLEVEVSELISLEKNPPMVTQTFEIA